MSDISKNPFFYLRRTNGKAFKISYDVTSINYQALLERMQCIGEKQFKIDPQNQILFIKGQPLNQQNLAQMVLHINISGKPENNIVHLIDRYKVLQQKISFLLVQVDLNKKDQMTCSTSDKVRKLIVDVLEGDQEYAEQFFIIYAGMILDPNKTFKEQYVENFSTLYFMDINIHLKNKDLLRQRLSTYLAASNADLKKSVFSFSNSLSTSKVIDLQKKQTKESKKDDIRTQNTENSMKSGQIKFKNQVASTTAQQKTCLQSRDELIEYIIDTSLQNQNPNAYLSSQKTLRKQIESQIDLKTDSLSAIFSSKKQEQIQQTQKKEALKLDSHSSSQRLKVKQNQGIAKDRIWATDDGIINNESSEKQITGKQIKDILKLTRKSVSKPDAQFHNKFRLNLNMPINLQNSINESQIVSYYQDEYEQQIAQSSLEEEQLFDQPQFNYQYEPFTIFEDPKQQPISLTSVAKSIRKRHGSIIEIPLEQISQQSEQNQNQSIRSKQVSGLKQSKLTQKKSIDGSNKKINAKLLQKSDREDNCKDMQSSRKSQTKFVKKNSTLKSEQDSAQLDELKKKGNHFITTNIQSTQSLNVASKSDFDSYLQQVLQKNTSMSISSNLNRDKKKEKPKKILNLESIFQNKSQLNDQVQVKTQEKNRNSYTEQKQRKLQMSNNSSKNQFKIQIKQVQKEQLQVPKFNQQQKGQNKLFTQRYTQQLMASWNKSINIIQGTSMMIEDSSDQDDDVENKQALIIHDKNQLSKQASVIIWKGDPGQNRISQVDSQSSEQQEEKMDKVLDMIQPQEKVTQVQAGKLAITPQYQRKLMTSWDKSINIMQGQSILLDDSSEQQGMKETAKFGQGRELRKDDSIIIWKGDGNLSMQGNQSSDDQSNQEDLFYDVPQIRISAPRVKSLPDPKDQDNQHAGRALYTSDYQKKMMESWNRSINIVQGQSIMLEDSEQEQTQKGAIGFRKDLKLSNDDSAIIWKGAHEFDAHQNGQSSSEEDQHNDRQSMVQVSSNRGSMGSKDHQKDKQFEVDSHKNNSEQNIEQSQGQKSDESVITWRTNKQNLKKTSQTDQL